MYGMVHMEVQIYVTKRQFSLYESTQRNNRVTANGESRGRNLICMYDLAHRNAPRGVFSLLQFCIRRNVQLSPK